MTLSAINHPVEAQDFAKRAFQLAEEKILSPRLLARVLPGVARALAQAGLPEQADLAVNKSLEAIHANSDATVDVSALLDLATALDLIDDGDGVISLADRIRVTMHSSSSASQRGPQGQAMAAQTMSISGKQTEALKLLQTALDDARRVSRSDVLEVVGYGARPLTRVDDGNTLWAIYEAMQEVDGWWHPA